MSSDRGLATRPVKLVGGIVLLLGVLIGGGLAAGVLGAPSVTGVDNRFGGVNDSTTVVETDLHVANPNPVGVDLGGVTVDYDVAMNGVRMATGTKEGVALDDGRSTLPFRTRMDNEQIPRWWVTHIRNDETTTLTVDAAIRSATLGRTVSDLSVDRTVETDLLAGFNSTETRPVNASAPGVSDPVLYLNETSARWGEVNESTTPMETRFVVYNPKSYPIPVSEIGYRISMNNVSVGNGTTDGSYVFEPGTTTTVEARTAIDNADLDDWWVSHLERDQTTRLRIDFYARIELPTGGTTRVPLDGLDHTKTFETDIFGTEGGSDSGGNASATPTRTATGGESTGTSEDDHTGTDDGAGDGTATTASGTAGGASTPTTTADGTESDDATASDGTTTDDGILSA